MNKQTLIIHPSSDENYQGTSRANVITILPNVMPDDLTQWEQIIDNMIERGYNWFHVGPFQKVGSSRSIYSIQNYTVMDDKFCQRMSSDQAYKHFCDLMQKKRPDCKFFVDIVMNHCSTDSDWIVDSKESTYNLENTPQLTLAYEVDKKLYKAMDLLVEQCDFIHDREYHISCHSEIDHIIHIIGSQILDKMDMEVYLHFNWETIEKEYAQFLKDCAKDLKKRHSDPDKRAPDYNDVSQIKSFR